MPPQQNPTTSAPLQSFKPYTGKAPVIIQIIGGFLWIGAAGFIIVGVFGMLGNPINSILSLVTAAAIIVTAKSLYSMKKTAFRNTIIIAALILLGVVYNSFSAGSFVWTNLVAPALLLFVAFYYKSRFVN
ncbi:MAG: hypothetical protein WCT02_02755 [Candidatus Paceibacterota bacterium]